MRWEQTGHHMLCRDDVCVMHDRRHREGQSQLPVNGQQSKFHLYGRGSALCFLLYLIIILLLLCVYILIPICWINDRKSLVFLCFLFCRESVDQAINPQSLRWTSCRSAGLYTMSLRQGCISFQGMCLSV